MYPVRLGYDGAISRVNKLLRNGHDAEAFVTAVFTIEKTFYRVLKQLVISAGFPSAQAEVLLQGSRGFENIKRVWECFDPRHERLPVFLKPKHLQLIFEAQTMRNDLVHGKKVFGLSKCREKAKELLTVLAEVRKVFQRRYGFDGWSKIKRRATSTLHSDPRVRVS